MWKKLQSDQQSQLPEIQRTTILRSLQDIWMHIKLLKSTILHDSLDDKSIVIAEDANIIIDEVWMLTVM